MFVPDICSECVSDSYSENFQNVLNKAIKFKDILHVSYPTCSVKILDIIVKFSIKSSAFLNRAHIIDIALPSFRLAPCKTRDSSFTNIELYNVCTSRDFPKFSE